VLDVVVLDELDVEPPFGASLQPTAIAVGNAARAKRAKVIRVNIRMRFSFGNESKNAFREQPEDTCANLPSK
jgi:hypothetical protein